MIRDIVATECPVSGAAAGVIGCVVSTIVDFTAAALKIFFDRGTRIVALACLNS